MDLVLRQKKLIMKWFSAAIMLASLMSMIGCSAFRNMITPYDLNTYTNLTETKPIVQELYESFTSEQVDEKQVSSVKIKISQIYEYEKGKGEKNKETTEQIKKIADMFTAHVTDRRTNGKWNDEHMNNKKELIGIAFDTAIQSENSKNRR